MSVHSATRRAERTMGLGNAVEPDWRDLSERLCSSPRRLTRGVENERWRIWIARAAGICVRHVLIGNVYVLKRRHMMRRHWRSILEGSFRKRNDSRFLTDEEALRIGDGEQMANSFCAVSS